LPCMKSTILVALTGWGTEQDRARSAAVGFDAHLTKPADIDALERLMAGIADRSIRRPIATTALQACDVDGRDGETSVT
jgi:CheY-like chemotaxis protein